MKSNHFATKLILIAFAFLLVGGLVGYKLVEIQFIEGDKYRKLASDKTIRNYKIKPIRGNIYSTDGSLLATSVTKYDIYFDTKVVDDKIFNNGLEKLSHQLTLISKKSQEELYNYILNARKNGNRYLSIFKGISRNEVEKIKKFSIFKNGLIKGGLIVNKRVSREYPLGKIAERTIGYERLNSQGFFSGVGLEHGFGTLLRGKDGFEIQRKIYNGQWKALDNENKKEPINGYDIVTTIDSKIQDIVHDYLLEQTEKFQADHSSAIVMEVETGNIKAISNFGITDDGKYYEKLNYAVGEYIEPGSTFKLAAIAAALEDQVIDTTTLVDEFEDFNSQKKAYKIADDFFKKSCTYIEEIKIKIEYYIKKIYNLSKIIKYKDIYFQHNSNVIYKKEQKIELTTLEKELLILFFKNKNRYLNKFELLELLSITAGTLKVKITQIRKLGFEIENKREIGYKLKEAK
jgi:cell division protein FtsI (penicillin-binding protein 3)